MKAATDAQPGPAPMTTTHTPVAGSLAIRIFALFGFAYLLSYGLRSVSAVIAPMLISDLGLSHAQLGSLGSAYFLGFAAMQLPLGVLLDRFGARRTDAALLLVAACGTTLFALADGFALLWIGRALVGAGVSACLMAAFTGFRHWYTEARQPQLAAWMLVVGSLGALIATVPVQRALPAIGWRGVFLVASLLLVAGAIALWWGLPRDQERANTSARGESLGDTLGGYRLIFTDRYFWRFGVLAVVVHSNFISLQSLWAGPWFVEVLRLSPERSAQALFAFNLVLMFSFLTLGWLAPRFTRRGWSVARVVGFGTLGLIAIEAMIALLTMTSAWLLWLGLAIVSTCFTLVQTHVGLSFPAALTGRAFTAFNLLIFAGIFVNQWLFGVVVDAYRSSGFTTPEAFRATMASLVVLHLAALGVMLGWRVGPARVGDATADAT